MAKAKNEPSGRSQAVGLGAFLAGALGPAFIAPELHALGFFVGLACLLYGFWPRVAQFHAWLQKRVPTPVEWLVWSILAAASYGAVLAGNAFIERQRYHLNYEMCFGHLYENTPSGPKIFAVKVWVRIMNRNSFPVISEVTENSLVLGSGNSIEQFPRSTTSIIQNAITAIRDAVTFTPSITPQPLEGNLRYVVKFGTDATKLDRTMIIKGRIDHSVSPNGQRGEGSFTPDGDSDPNYIQRECFITTENKMFYRGK